MANLIVQIRDIQPRGDDMYMYAIASNAYTMTEMDFTVPMSQFAAGNISQLNVALKNAAEVAFQARTGIAKLPNETTILFCAAT